MPRLRNVALTVGVAVLIKRALGRRVERSPLWPMPALQEPVSGVRRHQSHGGGIRVSVIERVEPADGVVALRLAGAGGALLPSWQPGAHIDLVLPSGLVRQYSLCGDPAEADVYTIATRLLSDGRGGSREVHDQLFEGDEVEIRAPRNRFPLVEAPAYLFLAGGIGITPLLPMIRSVQAAGLPWQLVYAGRSRSTMPFLAELEELAERADLDESAVRVEQAAPAGPTPGRLTVVPKDEAGRPDLAATLLDAPAEAAVYCCGPEPLMDAVATHCAERPPGGGLHLERFSPATRGPATTADRAFTVELQRSGSTVEVAEDTTVLAAIRTQALPNLPYSCEQGFCGTCQQRVVSGEIDHRDELLTDEEREGSMLICVSRAGSERLVLDL